MKYRVAQLGCSPDRGRTHTQAFLANADRFELVGLCDMNSDRLSAVSTEFQIDCTYPNLEEMLEREHPDIFCFVTHPNIRLEMVQSGIAAGVKAIALEKPMATSLREAQEIMRCCDEAGVKLIVSNQHKYNGRWQRLQQRIDAGAIGQVQMIYASAKGWLLSYATHLIDWMLFFNHSSPATWVVGHVHGKEAIMDRWNTHPSPDYLLGKFEFANGVQGLLECGTLARGLYPAGEHYNIWLDAGITIYGTEGYAQVIMGKDACIVSQQGTEILPELASDPPQQVLYLRDLADWLDDPSNIHPCNGQTSYHGFEIMMGAWLSGLDCRKLELPLTRNDDVVERSKVEL